MDWKLYDIDGSFLQDVNCQYDASDLATMLYEAINIELDFENKRAKITRKKGE